MLAIALVLAASPTPAGQQTSNSTLASTTDAAVDALLNGQGDAPAARVIVRAKHQADREDLKRRLRDHGDSIEREHEEIGAFTATVHPDDLRALAEDPAVASVSIDAIVRVHGAPAVAEAGASAALLGTLLLPDSSVTGKGIRVAVLDSGVQVSADLPAARIAGFFDLTRGPLVMPAKPYDDYGHGTHVAGLIAGNGAASGGYYAGLAPQADIVAFKVLDSTGAGYTSDVIQAIEFIVAHQWILQIDVINLSLGHPVLEPAATDPLVLAVERAVEAGIVVVAAAGNLGQDLTTGAPDYGGITSPGNAPSAITVGAVDIRESVDRGDDVVPAYSSRGPTRYDAIAKPDLVAPGHQLVSVAATASTLYRDYPVLQVGADGHDGTAPPPYFRLSGTSMAAAVASGAVALLLDAADQHRDSFGNNLVKALLEWSAIPVPGHEVLAQGAGALNVAGALTLARAIDPTVNTGESWLADPVTPVTTIAGVDWPWAQVVLWGDDLIFDGVIDTKLPVWGSGKTIIWGNKKTIIWGNKKTIIWGNAKTKTIIWGNAKTKTIIWGNAKTKTIIWGNARTKTIIWGNASARTIVWGNAATIVWGNSAVAGDHVVGSGIANAPLIRQ